MKILDGERNSTLYAFGRSLHAHGLNSNEILATLRASNQNRCHPPLPDDEVAEIAGSAFSNADAPGFSTPWTRNTFLAKSMPKVLISNSGSSLTLRYDGCHHPGPCSGRLESKAGSIPSLQTFTTDFTVTGH